MTTSASARTAGRSLSEAARPAYSAASRSARSRVRLTTTTSAAPRRETVAVASPAMAPAPTTTTRRPATSPPCRADRSRAAPTSVGCGAVDVGLGARALADPERLLEQHVEGRADGAELLAEPERVAGLAEDLALADGHRVEPGRDLEQVRDRAVVVVDVEVRKHRVGGLAGPLDQQPGELLDRAVEPVDVGVDLDPVAGRDDGRLGDVLAGGHGLDQLGDRVGLGRDLLQQGHRGGVVGDADHEDAHDAVTSPCLRCSW